MSAADWAEAIGTTLDDSGVPTAASIAVHIRSAIRTAGTLRRGQITRGLNEAYAPFVSDSGTLRTVIDRVLQDLVLIGDLTELSTASGAAYLLTPPRLVMFAPNRAVILGASDLEPMGDRLARRLEEGEWPSPNEVLRVGVGEELGLPDWRTHLVESGGADLPRGSAQALFEHVARLSAGGDRLGDLSSDKVRVLSGRQAYFGRYDAAQPEGRWHAAGADGTYCAVRHAGYRWRPCVVTVDGGQGTLWDTEEWDLWRWAVIGQTLGVGDLVYALKDDTAEFTALVPLPRQLRRLLSIGAEPIGAWRWRCAPSVVEEARGLLLGSSY